MRDRAEVMESSSGDIRGWGQGREEGPECRDLEHQKPEQGSKEIKFRKRKNSEQVGLGEGRDPPS